ncbi:MAG TPA: TRAP transporter substrate-binding protein DctP [Albitalea sp.]
MKRDTLRCLAGLALAAALAACSALVQAQTKLKWAHVHEPHEPFHRHARWAAEEIARRTAGQVQVEVFPAGALGQEPELHPAMALGTVDIVHTGLPFAGRVHPPLLVAAAPYAFRDVAHWEAFRAGPLFRELAQQYEAKGGGHHVAGLAYAGQRHLTARQPVQAPEDLRGVKLRVPDAALYRFFPDALGAEPTPVPYPALYVALKEGVVQAQENPLAAIESLRLHEVQDVLVLTGHAVDAIVTLVAAGTWSKLGEPERKVLDEVLWEAATRAGQEVQQREGAIAADLEKRGMTVVRPDRAPFIRAVHEALGKADTPWPKPLFERVQALR